MKYDIKQCEPVGTDVNMSFKYQEANCKKLGYIKS